MLVTKKLLLKNYSPFLPFILSPEMKKIKWKKYDQSNYLTNYLNH